ncbi:MAG: hypothetical protein A2V88_08975 [Elusimicrobia bacterium RBG_16_66_12]|nr:MAG: hypothetical protein A2V88_08975 [Elusimicrobia bacterium RBG_16_66_12]
MTIEFQDDVCSRAEQDGLPWLGIAHFGAPSRIGETTRLYRDGRMVKAEGTFLTDSAEPLQAALARAAYEAAVREAELLPAHRQIAVSQAFYPEAHAIEDCGVVAFTRGRIEHIALTTRKANSRCDFGVEEEDEMRRSKSRRELRREDAAAIVGEDLARQLDQADPESRAVEQDGLLYRMYPVGDGDGSGVEVSADGETWEDAHVTQRSMVPTHKPPMNDAGAAWSASEARSRIWAWATDGEDFDAARARQGFAVYDSDNPDNKTGMALPHHDIAEGKLVTHQRGCMAAAGVTMGARGGMKEFQSGDNERAQTHLAVHYGQMDRTPPWKREESNLRHWAEAMEEAEILHSEADLENARAFFRHRLSEGKIALPIVSQASEIFAKVPGVAAALLRATGETNFAVAIKAVVSDPDAVGQAAPEPMGRTAPEHRTLMPDSDYRSELRDRYGAEPDDSVTATIQRKQLMELAYTAAYTFVDIVAANVNAEPEELSREERLQNVQGALNEFGQIIASIISQAAERSQPAPDGVKPLSEGEKPVKLGGGPETEAQAAVTGALDSIRAAVTEKADAPQLQHLLEELTYHLGRCVEAPPPSLEDAVAPIMERLAAIEERLEDGGQRSDEAPFSAPPRRKGFRPRLDPPTIRSREADNSTPGPQGYSPEQFARGAHRRQPFNPYV